ncbi:MAG: 5'(3')-deoxyribonucleotidase [Saprospiraceae bacterium]|nr:5'(3')-deoxyribonucleotidase [Saprospiraceae bacterium]
MKRLAIDMDNVIADITEAFLNSHERETGVRLTPNDINGKMEREAFPTVLDWVNTEGYFRHLAVMPDSQRVVKQLIEHYDVFIVSAATQFPTCLNDKMFWLQDHFPFIGWQNICLCGSKTIIKADILIDDHFKNLDYFEGETLLYTTFHNVFANEGRHKRVNNWLEIEQILLP